MDWTQPHEIDYECVSVTLGWMDGEPFDLLSIDGIDVSADSSSASISLGESIPEQWVRLYAKARSSGDSERVPLYTGITGTPHVSWSGALGTWTCEIYSPMSCADDVLLPIGWWTDGHDPAQVAASLLARATPAPVECDSGSPNLTEPMIAEDGESCGSMARKLCKACGWRIRLDGEGVFHLERMPALPSETLDESANDVMMPDVDQTIDLAGIPNVFRVTSGDSVFVARDDDPDSMFSTFARGREIWGEERDVALNAGESLESYAKRALKEQQDAAWVLSYTREYMPLALGDMVRVNLPSIGIDANYRIISQHYNCSTGMTVDEEVELA